MQKIAYAKILCLPGSLRQVRLRYLAKQNLRVMKLILLLLTVTFLQVSAIGYSQEVTLRKKNASLEKIFEDIYKQTGYQFVYTYDLLHNANKISIDAKNEPLKKVLETCFKDQPFTYVLMGKAVVVKRKNTSSISPIKALPPIEVSGKVTDSLGNPLIGVTVKAKEGGTGTVTDANGNYSITVPDDAVLVVSYVGYQTKEISVNGREEIDVVLNSSVSELEQLVVVGYGTQKKKNITGALSSVDFKNHELESLPVTDVGQALSGKVSGVRIIQNNGQPGSNSTIQIRGVNSISANSSPLIVVDGNPLPHYNLNMINPADIESVDILKDAASAAIYGSRATNGVVLITTKSAKRGKPQVSLNYSYGIQKLIRKMGVMNAEEYAQAAIDAAQNGWIDHGGDPNAPNTFAARGDYKYMWPKQLEHSENLPNTDWQDVIFRTAPIQKINLRVSGSSEGGETTYSLSVGHIRQKGILINSNFKKYSLNTSISYKVNNWLKVGGMANLIYGNRRLPYNRIIEWAYQYPSIYPVYDKATGHLGGPVNQGFPNWSDILFRPRNGHPLYRIHDEITQNRINSLGNVFADFNILQGLDFRTTFNYYYHRIDNSNYAAINHDLGPGSQSQGVKDVNWDKLLSYNWQNRLTYTNDFHDHHLKAMLGFEYNQDNSYGVSAQRQGFGNDLIPYLTAGKDITGASESASESVLVSTFGRVNYNFKDKYLISASLRYDGSSRFGPNNKWGAFPSISAGWHISNEPFMNLLSSVSNLKIRASYGVTGNNNFGDYRWLSVLTERRVAFGNNLSITYEPSGFTNKNLKWEKTNEFDFGIDLGLFNNRITFTGDYYRSISDNLLLNVPIPAVTGFTNNFQNSGKLENKGFELSLITHNLIGEFKWTTNFNFSHNKSKIIALGRNNSTQIFDVEDGLLQINKVGKPLYSFYTYVFDGVYNNQKEIDADPVSYPGADPGDGKYVDVNNDGLLNSEDRKIIGNSEPDFTWGITNTFNYKRFEFSFVFQGSKGGLTYDENVRRSMRWHEGRNYLKEMVHRWRSPDDPGDGMHRKLTTELNGRILIGSSDWLFPIGYIRLKFLTFGYTFNQTLLSKIGLRQLRLYISGQNLFTITDSPIPDPESNNGGGARGRGITGYAYPTAKIYSIGINVSF